MGWIGMAVDLRRVLEEVGADRADDGCFKIGGQASAGFGGEEIVLGDDAHYFKAGQARPLIPEVTNRLLGVQVMVI